MKSPVIFALTILCGASAAYASSGIGNVDRGGMIFNQRCAMCHGENGQGREGMAPSFSEEWHRLTKPDTELANNIRTGQQTSSKIYSSGPPPQLPLSDRDMEDVLAYMRSAFGTGGMPFGQQPSQFNKPEFDRPQFGAPPRFGR